jgi:hypothetical protein
MHQSRWLRALARRMPSHAGRPEGRRKNSVRPCLEELERRVAPAVTLSIANPPPQLEGDSGTTNMVFVVTRSGDPAPGVTVRFVTQDGTAHANVDYVPESGTLTFPPNQTTALVSVPIIGDTIPDGSRSFSVVLFNPLFTVASFGPAALFPGNQIADSLVAADINGDGKPDLIVVNRAGDSGAGAVSVLLNTTPAGAAVATFAAPQAFRAGTGSVAPDPTAVAVGDFNGDGKPDLAVAVLDGNNPRLSVLLNTTPAGSPTVSFAPPVEFPIDTAAFSVVTADFNGDGKPDVAVVNYFEGTVSVLLNTTPTGGTMPSFTPQATFPVGFGGRDAFKIAAGDFNGDGKPDLAVAAKKSGVVALLENTTPTGAPTPSFAPQQTFSVGNQPDAVAVGDFNGDGKSDLVVGNYSDKNVSVLLNTTPTGSNTFTFAPQQTFTVGSGPVNIALADFNGDGVLDVAVGNSRDGTISVLLNTTPVGGTTPTFAKQQTFPAFTGAGSGPQGLDTVATADFNGDGFPDLAAASSSYANAPNNVAVLLNTRQPINLSPAVGTGVILDAAPPTQGGLTVSGLELTPLVNVPVATFNQGFGLRQPGVFSALIFWGDGASSPGVVVGGGGGPYTVLGSHTYADEGAFPVVVQITDDGTTGAIQTTALIHEEQLPAGGVRTPSQLFVSEVYRDLLGRQVDPSGLAHWSAQVDAGISRFQVVLNIENSTTREFFADEVNGLYLRYLHRPADLAALLNGVFFLEGGGTGQQIAMALVLTPEYSLVRAGGTADGFLEALFQDALGRPIDPGTLAVGEQMLAANPVGGRTLIATTVLTSAEFRAGAASQLFAQFFDRSPTVAVLLAVENALQAGLSGETLAAVLMATDEYFAKATF